MATVEDIRRIIADKKRRLEHLAKPNVWISYTKNMECGELKDFKQSCIDDEIIIEALERRIKAKPIIKYGDDTITHNLGRLMCFHCPNCGKYIVSMYETDIENGGGIHKDLKGCSTCLQAIDFTGYYHIDKLDEEIVLE